MCTCMGVSERKESTILRVDFTRYSSPLVQDLIRTWIDADIDLRKRSSFAVESSCVPDIELNTFLFYLFFSFLFSFLLA